ncbi:MAG TPA: type II toxin-antitoxin system VapC family toxin [Candidatus Binataceae bacterium]|nr:type II toxin-antitoxin system VapC family toxin [Candidatus Binataceae bacterium]
MRALLDTHAFLWWIADDPKLSRRARGIIADPGNQIFFSAVSGWEIAEKTRHARLTLPEDPEAYVTTQVAANGFAVLALELSHALRVYSLPPHHKDPFDRMLVAQAQIEDLALLSANREVARYAVKVIW